MNIILRRADYRGDHSTDITEIIDVPDTMTVAELEQLRRKHSCKWHEAEIAIVKRHAVDAAQEVKP